MGRSLLLVLWALPALAAEPLELGVYTPRLVFADVAARTDHARRLASSLQAASDVKVRGRAFTTLADLLAFARSGRIQLALVDVGAVLDAPKTFDVIGAGTGPEGPSPAYAVLAPKARRGVTALEGKRAALVDAGSGEVALVSNLVFEGELAIDRYFRELVRGADAGELVAALRSGRADCLLAYASVGRAAGLEVAAELRGVPLPVLAAVRGKVSPADRQALRDALAGDGLAIPPAGLLTRLVPGDFGAVRAAESAAALPAGQRAIRGAVWSPLPVEKLDLGPYDVKSRGTWPVPALEGRYRLPVFPDASTEPELPE